jgi:hypothetical protein
LAARLAKKRAQVGSTEAGSAVNCSNISSISQSLAPKSLRSSLPAVTAELDADAGSVATVAFFRCGAVCCHGCSMLLRA